VTPLEIKSVEYARRPEILHSSIQDRTPPASATPFNINRQMLLQELSFRINSREYDGVFCRFQIPDVRLEDRLDGEPCQIYFGGIVDASVSHQNDRLVTMHRSQFQNILGHSQMPGKQSGTSIQSVLILV
jgi:hypothetical protein